MPDPKTCGTCRWWGLSRDTTPYRYCYSTDVEDISTEDFMDEPRPGNYGCRFHEEEDDDG